jgi:hypothetical protein
LAGLTQALAAEGRDHVIRACAVSGGDGDQLGVWSPGERERAPGERPPERTALPAQEVAALVVWLAAAPAELVLNEAIVSPLEERAGPSQSPCACIDTYQAVAQRAVRESRLAGWCYAGFRRWFPVEQLAAVLQAAA